MIRYDGVISTAVKRVVNEQFCSVLHVSWNSMKYNWILLRLNILKVFALIAPFGCQSAVSLTKG